MSVFERDSISKIYLILAGIGIAVAIYHAYDELTQNFNSCNINSQVSCEGVFESGHTAIFGVPFYVLGLIWFPLAFILGVFAVQKVQTKTRLNPIILLPFLMIGNIFTLYLWYLELGVIGIICPVCVSLYIINYAMTALVAKTLLL
ncbi:MAG: vitamin K epoxide reductase family protein [Nitrososphaerales archaeon]